MFVTSRLLEMGFTMRHIYWAMEAAGTAFVVYSLTAGEENSQMVKCELCSTFTLQFNNHIKRRHPGCGQSAARKGYDSTGAYVDVWFKGECGSNFPFYLLCSSCREKYLAANASDPNSKYERYGRRIKGLTSDLIGQMDNTSDGTVAVDQKTSLSLGQQAVSLRDSHDRLKALRRVTSTAQILLAYSMVMTALSQTASSASVCSQSNGLESLGLTDIRILVRLMTLAAGGRAHTCVDNAPGVRGLVTERHKSTCFSFLTSAIGTDLMAAATGVNVGAITEPRQRATLTTSTQAAMQQMDLNDQTPPTFLVTQHLVSLLTDKNIHSSSLDRTEHETNGE
ncbi:hypothetical protein XENOCAPTIV_027538 [Xenoophorus captivus]|uniref:Uncharacterized protein n=1 Tax=Xenoophorus captivus TaxID=1517983 RepID=A0ABV0QC94_9TELE